MHIRSMQLFTNILIITLLSANFLQKLKNLRIQTFVKPQYSQRSFIQSPSNTPKFSKIFHNYLIL